MSSGVAVSWWYAGFVFFLAISMYLLVKVIREIPLGTAYSVWTGIGAVGSIMVSVLIFKDKITLIQSFFIMLLLIGIIGLKFFSKH